MLFRRILTIPTVATLAMSGALLFGAAGTASAAPAAQRAVAATAAPAAQRAVIAHQPRFTYKWYKYGPYSSEVTCEARGAALMGQSLHGGLVIDYNCTYVFGEGWILNVEVMFGCGGVPVTLPAKAAPDTRACP
jgi:hypothetical protein